MLDPNTSPNEISDEELIVKFNNPKNTGFPLYALMAKRANANSQIKNYLFEVIIDKEKRDDYIAGDITHAWIPAIFILQHSHEEVKMELKSLLKKWTTEEKKNFIDYIKQEDEYFNLLRDILE
jgi:hypothetical protein